MDHFRQHHPDSFRADLWANSTKLFRSGLPACVCASGVILVSSIRATQSQAGYNREQPRYTASQLPAFSTEWTVGLMMWGYRCVPCDEWVTTKAPATDTSLSTLSAPPKISCLQRKRTPTSADQHRGPGGPSHATKPRRKKGTRDERVGGRL